MYQCTNTLVISVYNLKNINQHMHAHCNQCNTDMYGMEG